MANDCSVTLTIKGKKETLDEIEKLFRRELKEGQTYNDYYTLWKTIVRMGYDSEKIDCRAYTCGVKRDNDEKLSVDYIAAWDYKPQVIIAICQRWKVDIHYEGDGAEDVEGDYHGEQEWDAAVLEYGNFEERSNYEAVSNARFIDDKFISLHSEYYKNAVIYVMEHISKEDRKDIHNEMFRCYCQHLAPTSSLIQETPIIDLLEEYGEEHDLPEGWYLDEYDDTEMFHILW